MLGRGEVQPLVPINRNIRDNTSDNFGMEILDDSQFNASKNYVSSQVSSITDNNVFSLRTFNVLISGIPLGVDKRNCITDITIKETVDGANSATLEIQDPYFSFVEDNIFLEENSIKIIISYKGMTYTTEFEGYISAIDINFDSAGYPKLTVTCMDKTHIMNRTKVTETYTGMTSADIVRKIAQKYGYACVIEQDYDFVSKNQSQDKQTDIEFLTRLASDEVYPFSVRLVGNTLYYVKKAINKEIKNPITLVYKKDPYDIISFSPKINKESKDATTTESTVDTANKDSNETTEYKEVGEGSVTSEVDSEVTYNKYTKAWLDNLPTYSPNNIKLPNSNNVLESDSSWFNTNAKQ